jgi:hypothetical protein
MYPGSTPVEWLFSSRKSHPEYCVRGLGYSGFALAFQLLNSNTGGFRAKMRKLDTISTLGRRTQITSHIFSGVSRAKLQSAIPIEKQSRVPRTSPAAAGSLGFIAAFPIEGKEHFTDTLPGDCQSAKPEPSAPRLERRKGCRSWRVPPVSLLRPGNGQIMTEPVRNASIPNKV